MKDTLLIYGGKSTALEILETALNHYNDIFDEIVLVKPDNESLRDELKHINVSNVQDFITNQKCKYIIGFSNHNAREEIQHEMNQFKVMATNIIHPSALISKSATIGSGNYIAAGSIISTNVKIHNHCIINFHVSIGHDSAINNNSIILPGSRVSGNVTIGSRSLIGANSFLHQGITVGKDCIIDAMTHVKNDIEDSSICSSRTFKKFQRIM